MATRNPRRGPRVDRIAEPVIHPGEKEFITEGRAVDSAAPGALLLVVGRGFGDNAAAVEVRVGSETSPLFPAPLFDDAHLLITVPDLDPGRVSLVVGVGGTDSAAVPLRIEAVPGPTSPTGALTQRFLTLGDALVVLGAAEAEAVDYGDSLPEGLKRVFDGELHRARSLIGELRREFASLDEDRARLADRLIDASRMVPTIEATLRYLRHGGESQSGIAMEINKKISSGWLDIVEGIGEASEIGFIKGASKVFRGWFLANYEIELQRKQAKDHEDQERERERKEEEARRRFETKLDGLEAKADREEGKLDTQELKLDFIKTLVDRLEGKGDYELQLIDRLESKADRQEGKLDRQEGKLDKVEAKLDHLEGKADLVEIKADRAESKLDRLESKLDKLEPKLDKLEPKIDKLEPKIDKLEPKIDLLEPKIDKVEPKLDSIQAHLDRGKEFWQVASVEWRVVRASRVGVRLEGAGSASAFSVESIQLIAPGARVVALVVDDLATDLSPRNVSTPTNLLVETGVAPVGASRIVAVELDGPYTGPVEFSGEKPHGARVCTVVDGPGATQTSPHPCP